MGFDAKRTEVAQSAFNFSQYFTSHFEQTTVGGAVPRRVGITAPEGMSTAAGRQARQPILLHPEEPRGAVLTVGWVEVASRRAMLRTYDCLLGLHRARFRDRPFDVDETSYKAFLAEAQEFLEACAMSVSVEDDSAAVISSRPPPPGRRVEPRPADARFFNYFAVGFTAFVIGAFAGGLAVYARFVGF